MLEVNIKSAGYKNKQVLHNISFSVNDNSFTAVLGRNGSGKSTLISAITALIQYDGKIELNGVDIKTFDRKSLAQKLSAMLQNTVRPHITVEELVTLGRSPYRGVGERLTSEDISIVKEAIKEADIESISEAYTDKISGGEFRRAYFAMLLAQNTGLVLLDEATAFMDADYESKFFKLSRKMSENKAVISVMHNLELAVGYADNILLLDKGRQAFFGSPERLLASNLIEEMFEVKRFDVNGRVFFSAD